MKTEFTRTANINEGGSLLPPNGGHPGGTGDSGQPGGTDGGNVPGPQEGGTSVDDGLEHIMNTSADRLVRQLTYFAVEPASQTALYELIRACPFGTVDSFAEGGNTMILADCNSYGETDAQPQLRVCPIPNNVFKTWARAVLQARCGSDEPAFLKPGDIFTCINGGKDRKRAFMGPLKCQKLGRDKDRTFSRSMMLFVSEPSYKARRGRIQGHSKLTQSIYMCMNFRTLKNLPQAQYPIHGGSNKCDVFGPVTLDAASELPRMTGPDKLAYLGKRRVLAGGKLDSGDEGDDAAESEKSEAEAEAPEEDANAVKAETKFPINYQCLPVSVVTDLVVAQNVKHVIDLCPTPLDLALELVKKGISYADVLT